MNFRTVGVATAFAAMLAATPAQATLLYSNDFDGNVVIGSGITAAGPTNAAYRTATVGTWNAAGWERTVLYGNVHGLAAEFTLSGIGAHDSIALGGILGFLDSWDSTNGSPAPDYFEILVDGTVVAQLTSKQASGNVEWFDGGVKIADMVQADSNFFYTDVLVDMAPAAFATFAHSAPTLTLGFRAGGNGWQGGGDEAWGLDSLTVESFSSAVPEPATWAMMIGGLGFVGGAMRRRQRVSVRFA